MGSIDRSSPTFDGYRLSARAAAATAHRPSGLANLPVQAGARGRPMAAQRRSFDAGKTDRLTASWTATDETMNQSLLRNLRTMRARSRDFARNDEYGRKFFSLVKTNVIGPNGVALKFECKGSNGKVDVNDSRRLKAAFDRWAERGQCDVTGKLSWVMIQQLAAIMVARDGEVLIRKVMGADRGIHHVQLQLLPGHVLDEQHNRDLPHGGRIRMGVEFDAWMKPVAYHLRLQPPSADMWGSSSQRFERVPADEIIHLFVPEEIDQWRGAPWAYASLRGSRHLDQYQEAAIVAANVGAAKMGFFQQKDAEAGPITGERDGDGGDGADFVSEATPGSFDIIPDGYELVDYNPDYPHAMYDQFVRATLRKQATGLLTTYHSLSGDLTDVNFSSIRSGTLDERESWKVVQGWIISDMLKPVITWWLTSAMLWDVDLRQLPYEKFDKFNAPVLTPRRWDWVDPKSDMAANAMAVELEVTSRAQIIRERGGDPEQIWAELAEEKQAGRGLPKKPAAKPADGGDDTTADDPKDD